MELVRQTGDVCACVCVCVCACACVYVCVFACVPYECMNELVQDPLDGKVQVPLANGQTIQVVLADI